MKRKTLVFALITCLLLSACGKDEAAGQATIIVTFDMGGGGATFAATIYAQEVTSGRTFHTFYAAPSHGLVNSVPTSAPVTISVDAPGTYVFYAVLVNEDSYHYGATGCRPGKTCAAEGLLALDVEPGGTYSAYVGDRSAPIPPTGVPVEVPWQRAP